MIARERQRALRLMDEEELRDRFGTVAVMLKAVREDPQAVRLSPGQTLDSHEQALLDTIDELLNPDTLWPPAGEGITIGRRGA